MHAVNTRNTSKSSRRPLIHLLHNRVQHDLETFSVMYFRAEVDDRDVYLERADGALVTGLRDAVPILFVIRMVRVMSNEIKVSC